MMREWTFGTREAGNPVGFPAVQWHSDGIVPKLPCREPSARKAAHFPGCTRDRLEPVSGDRHAIPEAVTIERIRPELRRNLPGAVGARDPGPGYEGIR